MSAESRESPPSRKVAILRTRGGDSHPALSAKSAPLTSIPETLHANNTALCAAAALMRCSWSDWSDGECNGSWSSGTCRPDAAYGVVGFSWLVYWLAIASRPTLKVSLLG